MKSSMRTQRGFTLVETATVLVIVGLLLGGALQGRSMIENAKVKALASEMRAVFTMLDTYRDVYKNTPGDDEFASTNIPGASSVASLYGGGSGAIDTGEWTGRESPIASSKTSMFWHQVRRAGLAAGASSRGFANNTLGGRLGITSGSGRPKSPAGILGNFYVCSSWIPGKLARSLDIMLDDGRGTTGLVFGSVESGNPVTTATDPAEYSDVSNYTVCMAGI